MLHPPYLYRILLMVAASIPMISLSQKGLSNSLADSLFKGTWKGTSVCQVKNSPCHDEEVIYYIPVEKDNIIEISASKIVNGSEVKMGKVPFKYDRDSRQIISIDQHAGVFKFARSNDELHGTLQINNELYRVIDLKKEN